MTVARKKGIPSLTLLAGQIFDHPQYGFLNADVIAVNGEPARNLFLSRGISPDRVVVTGMAHYDETFKCAERLQASRKSTELRLVVFATENLPLHETLRMISAVAEAIMMKPGLRLAIRPHPREDEAIYKDYVGKFHSDKIYVDSTTPLLELFSKTDVVVTGFSNVAVEAMILERPVICMNLGGKPDKLGYIQERAALGIYRPEDTASALDKALSDERVKTTLAEGRRAFLEKHFYRVDGRASERIVDLIEKLTKRNHA